jgi:short-subunit dehydrogenase
MKIAIVTGASSGIGREFVKQIDERTSVDEIWVIARRAERLEELKNIIKSKIVPISMALSQNNSDEILKLKLSDEKPEVEVLVNAAGYGKFGRFEELPIEDQCGMIELNATAMTKITFCVLPYMKCGAQIYQICSRSGFHPVPYISVYAATKAYALSFSRALNVELKDRGIRSIAVSPGWVRTEFFDRAAVDDTTIVYYNNFVSAKQVVNKAFKDMNKKKDVSICGFSTIWQVMLAKLISHRLVMWIWCKQQKK